MSDTGCAEPVAEPGFLFTEVPPSRRRPSMAEEVRAGLSQQPRELHPKYFYDERGSQLFDLICDTPEYYLTRTESALLDAHAARILAASNPDNILELGSGTSRKTRLLLNEWTGSRGLRYLPFDVSAGMLEQVAGQLATEYPRLTVQALVGDYTAGFGNFPDLDGRTLALFLGSTLGNFAPEFAESFLVDFASHLNRGDHFLLGADLHKDPAILEAAYNDAQGVTAQFNKNVLAVLNRELDADFDLEQFEHRAIYNRNLRRMEMYLDSMAEQTVTIAALGMSVRFRAGESILTEISRKFTPEELRAVLGLANLEIVEIFSDQQFPYALVLAAK